MNFIMGPLVTTEKWNFAPIHAVTNGGVFLVATAVFDPFQSLLILSAFHLGDPELFELASLSRLGYFQLVGIVPGVMEAFG